MAVPGCGQLLPAVADIMAGEGEPPQQRRGVDHVERDHRAVLADRAVIERQHLIGLAEIEMAEREMPPVVNPEEIVVAGPVRFAGDHPADAVLGAPLHFHDMGDGVVRP